MKKIKELAKSLLYSVIIFFILTLIYTIFSYFNIFSSNINIIIKLTLPIVVFFTGGFLVGRKADKNGWFEGIKESFILSFIMTIITIILGQFKIDYLLYLLILSISSVFGSIMGINKKN